MNAVITSGHNVTINIEEIPEPASNRLARATLRYVERLFQIPGVREDYEKWLVEYRKRDGIKND